MTSAPTTTTPAHRVVLVGHGMVGARFLDELDRLTARTGGAVDVTVLAEETTAPYNRLLLSEVVAGRATLAGLVLPPAPDGMTVHPGRPALRIDRGRRVVCDSEGVEHPYDTVVLATGAAAAIPPVPGLAPDAVGAVGGPGPLGPGVCALRDWADCETLLEATDRVRHVTVVGGGVLGVEVACGLRRHGTEVTMLHRGAHPMDRQLGQAAGRTLALTLGDLGVDVRCDIELERVERDSSGVVAARAGGERIETELVVLTAGTLPRVRLARTAGLTTRRGVVVGSDLRSPDDPAIAAIGDCAETPAGCPGLLAPGWEQATLLAHDLCGVEPSAAPGPDARPDLGDVVRLKAVGAEALALGQMPERDDGDGLLEPRLVRLVDLGARRSVEIAVLRGRLVGAAAVGAGRVASDLLTAFERGLPLPGDPAHALLQGGPAAERRAEASPTMMPGSATVCRCNGVSKKEIVTAWREGARDRAEVAQATRATTGCGGCGDVVQGLVEWLHEVDPDEGEVDGPVGRGSVAADEPDVSPVAEAAGRSPGPDLTTLP
ncbi:FAD-dependent oxidoreductase [Actinomycetota bacterium]